MHKLSHHRRRRRRARGGSALSSSPANTARRRSRRGGLSSRASASARRAPIQNDAAGGCRIRSKSRRSIDARTSSASSMVATSAQRWRHPSSPSANSLHVHDANIVGEPAGDAMVAISSSSSMRATNDGGPRSTRVTDEDLTRSSPHSMEYGEKRFRHAERNAVIGTHHCATRAEIAIVECRAVENRDPLARPDRAWPGQRVESVHGVVTTIPSLSRP